MERRGKIAIGFVAHVDTERVKRALPLGDAQMWACKSRTVHTRAIRT